MADFPESILVEFLIRLPTKSLVRFRCVCKLWKSLLTSPPFIKAHFDLTSKLPKYNLLQYDINKLSRWRIHRLDNHELSIIDPQFNDSFNLIDSCNGVICFSTFHNYGFYFDGYDGHENLIILWNPSINEKIILPSPQFHVLDFIGFGIDSSSNHLDDFKVVNINVYWYPNQSSQVEVYSSWGNNWKQIGDIYPSKLGKCLDNQVIMGKFIFWSLNTEVDSQKVAFLISFDVINEVFYETELPNFLASKVNHLTSLDGCLSLIAGNSSSQNFEVWVMKEFNVIESWTMLYKINTEACIARFGSFLRPLGFTSSGEIFFACSTNSYRTHKYTMCFNLVSVLYEVKGDKFVKFDVEVGNFFTSRLLTYMETLISPVH